MDLNKLSKKIIALYELVSRLRGPGGCPWDAEQTDSTIKIYLLEEAYEVLDAVEEGSPEDLCFELGDLLFQILFLAEIAEERGDFNLVDVVEGITQKMVRRHPHVFGNTKVEGSDQVAQNWAKIKREEKPYAGSDSSKLKEVPVQLPALLRAHRLGERASKSGLDPGGEDTLWRRVKGHIDELERIRAHRETEDFGRHFGDVLQVLVDLARQTGHNAENLMREANQRFIKRFERAEGILRGKGLGMEEATGEQKKRAWDEAGDKEED